MKQKIMEEIMQQMLPYLDNAQLQKLQKALEDVYKRQDQNRTGSAI